MVPRSHIGEWIEEKFEPWLDSSKIHRVLDLCCGGGSIGIACALYMEQVRVDLADLSADALAVARQNIENYQLAERVNIIHSDLFEAVEAQYDLIVCNPPYVSLQNMEKLPTEYRYEPEMALTAGQRGLDTIAHILKQAHQYLTDHGALILEAGTAAPQLEAALEAVPMTWLMSASGESVVLLITKKELHRHASILRQLTA